MNIINHTTLYGKCYSFSSSNLLVKFPGLSLSVVLGSMLLSEGTRSEDESPMVGWWVWLSKLCDGVGGGG